jgi:hypothetical protein
VYAFLSLIVRLTEAGGSAVYAFLSLIVRLTEVRRNRLGRSGSACICTCKWAAVEREARWPIFGPAEWNAAKGFNIAQHCKPHRRRLLVFLPSQLAAPPKGRDKPRLLFLLVLDCSRVAIPDLGCFLVLLVRDP